MASSCENQALSPAFFKEGEVFTSQVATSTVLLLVDEELLKKIHQQSQRCIVTCHLPPAYELLMQVSANYFIYLNLHSRKIISRIQTSSRLGEGLKNGLAILSPEAHATTYNYHRFFESLTTNSPIGSCYPVLKAGQSQWRMAKEHIIIPRRPSRSKCSYLCFITPLYKQLNKIDKSYTLHYAIENFCCASVPLSS